MSAPLTPPTCISPSGTPLWLWTQGSYRPVPPPTVCAGCGKPAEGLISWTCAKRLGNDFPGCWACAKAKRQEIEALGIVVRAGKLLAPRSTTLEETA